MDAATLPRDDERLVAGGQAADRVLCLLLAALLADARLLVTAAAHKQLAR